MPHVDRRFLVLESLDDLEDVPFDLFDVFGIDVCCDFASEVHEQGHSVGAYPRKGNSEMRVVFLQFYLLEVFLDTFVDLVGNLNEIECTAFSGRKRKSLKASMSREPKGMISTTAST